MFRYYAVASSAKIQALPCRVKATPATEGLFIGKETGFGTDINLATADPQHA